jgi:hypothetical protein
MGSGFRGKAPELDEAALERVREASIAALAGVGAICTTAIYGAAIKPAGCAEPKTRCRAD